MEYAKSAHAICGLDSQTLFTGGGYDGSSQIAICEKYEIHNDTWNQSASLNQPKHRLALTAFQSIYLYAFCGYAGASLSTIEMLKLNQSVLKWEMISVKVAMEEGEESAFWFSARCECLAAPVNQQQIIVFGGVERNDSFIFNVETCAVKEGPRMSQPLSFSNFYANPLVFDDKVFAMHAKTQTLQVYDVIQNKWNQISIEE